jgi:hypothetical protein
MGADLYIEAVVGPARKKWEPLFLKAVAERDKHPRGSAAHERLQKDVEEYHGKMRPEDGYFRDSYNATNVLWTVGLSWWQDVVPMLKGGNLRPLKTRELLRMIKSRRQRVTASLIKKQGGAIDKGENTLAGWRKYYTEKLAKLVAFLERAIQMEEDIYCSL